MPQATIDRLIINSPYEEPGSHWKYERETRRFDRVEGRRPAGYLVASERSRVFDDPGVFVEIALVNQIRERVKAWREAGYPGVTGVTKRLLEYWTDPEEFEARRFFFCQLEAAETLIWLTEAPAADRVGIEVPSDGGAFRRVCSKMATGSGKTVVMAMLIAWQVLNKVAYRQDTRFSKNVLVIAPGLTVRSRLAVLEPSHPENYYEAFRVVPSHSLDRLRQGKVVIRNWHVLNWETDEQIARGAASISVGPRATKPTCATYLARCPGRAACWLSTTRRITPGALRRDRGSGASQSRRSMKPRSGWEVWTESTARAAFSPATISRRLRSRRRAGAAPRRRCSTG